MSGQVCDPDKGCWLLSDCEWNQINYRCVHDPILELTVYTGFVFSLIPIFLGIGVIGGLGAGMIKRPILNLLLNYSASVSTQICDCFLFSTTLFNSVLLFFEKHPDHHKLPLVNFNATLIFNLSIPISWCIGAVFSQQLPTFALYMIQLAFLFCCIPFLWHFTGTQKQLELDKRNEKVLIIDKIPNKDDMAITTTLNQDMLIKYEQFYNIEHSKIQWKNLSLIAGSFILNQCIIMLRSNKYNKSIIGLLQCSVGNDMIILMLVFGNMIYTSFVYWIKRNEEFMKDLCQFRPDQRFFTSKKMFWQYYIGGFLAGFSTGFIGMGGGIILVSFLLHNKMIVREAAATSAFGSFMIALNSLIQLLIQKSIDTTQLLVFFFLGTLGIFIFTKPAYILMNKLKVGYVVLIVDIIQVFNNILSIVGLIIINSVLYGFDSMTTSHRTC